MNQETVNPELFRWNRKRFLREMLEDSVAIFCSNDQVGSNGNVHGRFRQNPDLYYLSGVTQPETMLILAPNTAKQDFDEVLFIRRPDHRDNRLAGPGLDLQSAAQLSGITQVCYLDELDAVLHELILLASRVYVNSREDRYAYSEAPARDLRFAERLMKLYPAHKYHRAQPILKKIGMAKSAPEVGLLSKAAELTNTAFITCADTVAPQRKEHEVEAAIAAAVISGGAQGLSHPTRVASGSCSLYPHYNANTGKLKEGEILQIQLGVVYAGYHASIARVLPVNGTFTDRQAEVYRAVEQALRKGATSLVPGRTLLEYENEMKLRLEDACADLGLSASRRGIDYVEVCYHHVGRNQIDPYLPYVPLQSGMVFSCQPGIYLHDEGFGMQLRNLILVTDNGPVDLTANVALSIAEIEAIQGELVP